MNGLFSHPALRMEAIDFQINDPFPKALEGCILEVIDLVKKGYENFELEKQPVMRKIEQLILDRFGLRIRIDTKSGHGAAIIPFYANDFSILFAQGFRGKEILKGQTEFKKNLGVFKGTVDEKNARLGGDFSKYTSNMFYDADVLHGQSGINEKEMTAIILHELGHAFYGCVLSNRIDTSNQVISNALRVNKQASRNPVDIIVDNFKKEKVELKRSVVEGLTSSNPITLTKSMLTVCVETTYSQMESGKYDNTSFEQLADNFAARFGYSNHIVTGLEKLIPFGVKGYFWLELTVAVVQAVVLWEAFKSNLSDLLAPTAPESLYGKTMNAVFKLASFYYLVVIVITTAIIVNSSGEAGRDYTYDDFVKRYNRARNEVVEMIKTKKLTNAQAKQAIASYEEIGKIIQGARTYRGPLDFLFNTLNPKDRRAKSSIERQQAIEDLMSNELFVVSMRAELAAVGL